jgi:precorrin-6B methylase 2
MAPQHPPHALKLERLWEAWLTLHRDKRLVVEPWQIEVMQKAMDALEDTFSLYE